MYDQGRSRTRKEQMKNAQKQEQRSVQEGARRQQGWLEQENLSEVREW